MFVNHNLRAVRCGLTDIALPTARLRSWVCSQGQLCCLPTRKKKRVWHCSGWIACAWIIQCFQAGWKKNGIYVIQSLVCFLFLLLGGIRIKFSTESYTLKCSWDKCNSDSFTQQQKFVPRVEQIYLIVGLFLFEIQILSCRNLNSLHTSWNL